MCTNGSVVSVRVIDIEDDFFAACELIAGGDGPVAIDAERASGFTYSQRAYLIQVHRRGSGTFLFDPPAIGDMSRLTQGLEDEEWVLHAASQDLACLREVGIQPGRVFDTELSARLLGMPKVGLGAVMADVLDVHLAKEHSAVDWSTRPLPEPWLAYAVGDVERLVDLRDALHAQLEDSGKLPFALQEFEAVRTRPEKESPAEPWRRLSGTHNLRKPRQLAVARALWLARDELARTLDVSPGRLIPDASIVAAASAALSGPEDLAKLKAFNGRASRTEIKRWWQAISDGLTATDLPVMRPPSDALPHPRSWPEKNPEAAERLAVAKTCLAQLAEDNNMPQENLMSPAVMREVCWAPPQDLIGESLVLAFVAAGARRWQAEIVAPALAIAFAHMGAEPQTLIVEP